MRKFSPKETYRILQWTIFILAFWVIFVFSTMIFAHFRQRTDVSRVNQDQESTSSLQPQNSKLPNQGKNDEDLLPFSPFPKRERPQQNDIDETPVTSEAIKVGSRLVAGLPQAGLLDEVTRKALTDGVLGGLILMEKDLISPPQTEQLCGAIKEAAKQGGHPAPIICIDVEGGQVNRVRRLEGAPFIPSAAEMGKMSNENIEKKGRDVGLYLHDLGINVNLAPVVDLGEDLKSGFMVSRVYAKKPQDVINAARAFSEGMMASGIRTCLKHYPGHGLTQRDSHNELIRITKSRSIIRRHQSPFFKLIEERASDSIMLSHLLVEAIDKENPISLSKPAVDQLYQEVGKDVILWTDSGAMGALDGLTKSEALTRSLNAGATIFLTTEPFSRYGRRMLANVGAKINKAALNDGYEKALGYRRKLR